MKILRFKSQEATGEAIYKLLQDGKHYVVTGRIEICVFEEE